MSWADGKDEGVTRSKMLGEIRLFIANNRCAPTYRELMDIMGLTSPSTVKYHLRLLRSSGAIEYLDNSPRSIVVLDGICAHCGGSGLES